MTTDSEVPVRRATARDADRIEVLVRSLSRDSIGSRFMGGITADVAVKELRREVQGAGSDIALIAEDARGEIVGEAYAAMLAPHDAEASFVVRDHEQHHGVGKALFNAIVALLRARGVRRLHADTQPGNAAMLALLHGSESPMQSRCVDGCVHVTLYIGDASPTTAARP
jgi:GNAT superfamily N-acetyltransferase